MIQPMKTAVSLMKMPLALLDRDGEDRAALYLQHAIDIVQKSPLPQPNEELSPDLIKRHLGATENDATKPTARVRRRPRARRKPT